MSTFQNRRHTYYGGTVLTSPSNQYNTGTTTHSNISTQGQYTPQHHPQQKIPSFGPYLIGSTLGQGEFGKVKLGWSKTNPSSSSSNANNYSDISKQVAIKLIRRDTLIKDKSKEIKIYREINALKQLNHPNIVKLEEVLQNSKYIGIVLEYASGGEFYKYIQKRRRIKETVACKLFAQLISGVSYIHSKGLVHRDLKLENLLLDKNENLIITDFGFVNEYYSHNELMETSCGSPCYAAPELVISNRPYEARKADIWSCGIILFAMLAGYLPWDDDSENPDGEDIARLYYYIIHTPLKFPDYISPIPRDLLRHILVTDPTKRICMDKIIHHPWLSSYFVFLSITSLEWDKLTESRDVLRLPKHSKTYSSQRPHSTCSMSSNNSRNTSSGNEKRNSLIMDSTLFVFPAPPREYQSHVLAIPSSPSPELRSMNSRSPIKRGHNRSNSAASLALQAVVDADRQLFGNNNHHHHQHSNNNNNDPITSNEGIINSNNIPTLSDIKNNNTIEGSSVNSNNNTRSTTPLSIMDNNNQSIISPLAFKNRSSNQMGNISPLSQRISINHMKFSTNNNNNNNNNLSTASTTNRNKSKVYHSNHRKPRPTSYYPGLIPESESSYSSISITPMRTMTHTPSDSNNTVKSPFDSIPNLGTDTAVTSMEEDDEEDIKIMEEIKSGGSGSHHQQSKNVINSNKESPRLMARKTSSIFSKTSIDKDVNVNGDIMKTHGDIESIIKRVQESVVINVSDEPSLDTKIPTQRRRFSMFATPSTLSPSNSITPPSHRSPRTEFARLNRHYTTSSGSTHSPVASSSNANKNKNRYSMVENKRKSVVVTPPVIIEDETPTYESINVSAAPHNNTHYSHSRAKKVIDFFKRKSMRI